MHAWKLEDAKNRFSELVRRALDQGPQLVTRGGRAAVVVLSAADYERLAAPDNVVDFMQASPLAAAIADGALDIDEVLRRPRDLGRDVDL
jgi:prevent-host-death family protein